MSKRVPWGWPEWALLIIGTPISALRCVLMAVAVALLGSTGAHAATQYFGWDVESGTFSSTFDIYADPSAVAIVTDKAHTGTKSVFYNPRAPGADQTNSPVKHLPNLNTVYLSFWWWVPSALEGGEGGQHFFRFGSSAAQYFTNGQLDPTIASPGGVGFGFDAFDGASGDTGTTYHSVCGNLPTNQWFKFSMLATINSPGGTANGVFKCWVNDVLRYSSSTVLFATAGAPLLTTKWNEFLLVTNFDNAPEAGAQWWMDDIEVWDGEPVGGSPPVANFTCSPLTLQAPAATTCTDSSTNTPTSWNWNCGNSTSCSTQNCTCTYALGGRFTVTLTATNGDGSDDEVKSNYITARAKKPVAPH